MKKAVILQDHNWISHFRKNYEKLLNTILRAIINMSLIHCLYHVKAIYVSIYHFKNKKRQYFITKEQKAPEDFQWQVTHWEKKNHDLHPKTAQPATILVETCTYTAEVGQRWSQGGKRSRGDEQRAIPDERQHISYIKMMDQNTVRIF